METIATSSHLPALEKPHEREGIGQELQATVHNLIDLSLTGKQLHWAVVGPLFRPLHAQLDELVDSWRELADTVAERAVALGSFPDGQAAAGAGGSGPPRWRPAAVCGGSPAVRSRPGRSYASSPAVSGRSASGLVRAWTDSGS